MRHQAKTAIPASLVIQAESRWPTRLAEETLRFALESAVPEIPSAPSPHPRVSIVVTTCGQLPFTKLCLASVLESCRDDDYELIVVDNASLDGTREYLKQLCGKNPQVRVILNTRNRGFARANNQALAVASGKFLFLLNNDTLVAPGWIETLTRHLEDRRVGMAGPLTNRSGGENEIDADYRTYGEFLDVAAQTAGGCPGASSEISMLPMLCAAMRRDVWSRVGPLDEGFQIGLFEDDDYCLRIRQAGSRLLCANDCFVHHFGQASMGGSENYGKLFERNRERFEKKWGRSWRPRKRRISPAYLRTVERIRECVAERLPGNGEIVVISRGDEEVLKLGMFRGRHFMEGQDGRYAGHHPADSAEAIARLHDFQRQGVHYLVVPEVSAWWLDYYVEFRRHLERHCRLAIQLPGTCKVYRLEKQGLRKRELSS